MLFRHLAMALILTMVVALVGFACGEAATATPEAMRGDKEIVHPLRPVRNHTE